MRDPLGKKERESSRVDKVLFLYTWIHLDRKTGYEQNTNIYKNRCAMCKYDGNGKGIQVKGRTFPVRSCTPLSQDMCSQIININEVSFVLTKELVMKYLTENLVAFYMKV